MAVDEGWNPIAGVPVSWQVVAGGGTLTGAETITGPNGVARTTSWTLGTTAGPQRIIVHAELPHRAEWILFGLAVPGPVATIEKLASDFQVAMAGAITPEAPRVRVLDQYGNAAHTRQVIFRVSSGGGSVNNTHDVSATDGTAGVSTWRLGPTPGENRLRVEAGDISAEFVATGTP
jgi:hypothetical protein